MPTPTQNHRYSGNTPGASTPSDWRCQKCFKRLGRETEAGVHVRCSRGNQYLMSRPVSAVCRCCGKLNTLNKLT